jgi:large subunit ribosomal protein L23
MNTQERLMAVLVGPHVSEKAAIAADKNRQVVFKVLRDATKDEIRAAVETMFNVKVEGVTVSNMHGKLKRFGQSIGHRSDWKKAYVTLAEGQDIDFAGGSK